jgi:uncharacterized protein YjiS (DUF1127 family)
MSIFNTLNNWKRARQTRNELSNLSNRELQDLGITRSDIPFIARSVVK